MDTFENDEFTPQEQTPETDTQEDFSVYHGTGTGRREETWADRAYSAYHTEQPDAFPVPKKKKNAGKVWKGILAAVLALVVIAGSCTATAFLTAKYLKEQENVNLQQYVDQKIQAILSTQNSGNQSGTTNVVVTVDGMAASEIYEKNINSIVAVTCTVTTGGVGQNYQATSTGTGFILSEDGFIVTNYHVVEGASSVKITLENGQEYDCLVRGYDAANDVAVLKAQASGLTPVTIGKSSELKVGDPVVAIGNALGELSFSLTAGNISGVDREITTDGTILNMLQTDAAINSGNSGGPLFNARGEVVGITTAKYSGTTSSGASIEGISFAIPLDDVISIIDDLRDYGYVTGAYMGVSVSDVDATAQKYGVPAGAYVREVVKGYCAAKAGLQAGDIIIELGGYDVTGVNTLTRALRNFKAGDTAVILVWRSGREVTLSITFDEKPQP